MCSNSFKNEVIYRLFIYKFIIYIYSCQLGYNHQAGVSFDECIIVDSFPATS